MVKARTPVTAAVRMLRAANVQFTDHLYTYEERGGTSVSARELGVDEHSVIKTEQWYFYLKNPRLIATLLVF